MSRVNPGLFDNGDARHQLNATVDSLNLRYGKNTLYYGDAHQSLDAAPVRIAFNHIPDLALLVLRRGLWNSEIDGEPGPFIWPVYSAFHLFRVYSGL